MPEVEIVTGPALRPDLVLVVIGPAWGLSSPDVGTVAKIEEALTKKQKLVPVLVQRAKMPPGELLPARVRPFSLLRAVELRHASFSDDLELVLKEVKSDTGVPWEAEGATGTIRISSRHRGLVLGLVGRWDSGPVTIRIDDAAVGVMHLFGDSSSFAVAPGKHVVLFDTQFAKPIEVAVPSEGTVELIVERNLVMGWVKQIQ